MEDSPFDSSPAPVLDFGDRDSFLISNARNVVGLYTCTSSHNTLDLLTLFIDLGKREGVEFARCTEGQIGSLPVLLDLRLTTLQTVGGTDKLISNLLASEDSHSVGRYTKWSVEGQLLRLDVDMNDFPERSAGEISVELEKAKAARIGRSCLLNMTIRSDPTSTGSWTSHSVARQLQMMSTTPRHSLSRRGSAGSASMTPSRGEWALRGDLDGQHVQVSDVLSVNTSHINATRIIFYPESYNGNVFMENVNLFSEVVAHLSIQILEEGDPRLVRRNRVQKMEPINLYVEEGVDKERNESTIVLTFNAEEVFGAVEDVMMINMEGASSSSQLVSNCSQYRIGRYIIDFTATWAGASMPTERETYDVIAETLESVGTQLQSMNTDYIYDAMEENFSYFFNVAEEKEVDLFKTRIWSCLRLYVIHTMMRLPPPSLDDVGDIIANM